MLKKLRALWSSDAGDSELVSALILLPLIMGVLFTMVDTTVYFANRSQISSIARDGARTVAIMGGDGTSTSQTPIEARYGSTRSSLCGDLTGVKAVTKAYNPSLTSNVECSILKAIADSSALVNIEVLAVDCSPSQANNIGQRTSCAISWNYGSIPGSTLTLIRKEPAQNAAHGFAGEQLTIGTSESEVDLSGISMVSR